MRFDAEFEHVMAPPVSSGQGQAVADDGLTLDEPARSASRLKLETLEDFEADTRRLLSMTGHDSGDPLALTDRDMERLRQAEATASALVIDARRRAEALLSDAEAFVEERRIETEQWCRRHRADADQVATQRILDAESRAREILEQARADAAVLRAESRPDEAALLDAPVPVDEPSLEPAPARGRWFARPATAVGILALLVVTSFVVANLLRALVAEQYSVSSTSMEPVLHDGDRLLVNKVAYELGEVQRGDIVIVDTSRMPDGPPDLGETVVKRVVGLPGEVVHAELGQVWIDGSPIDESWLGDVQTQPFAEVKVPPNSLFLLGDERALSTDSRTFGPVPVDAVIGRVEAIVWPPAHVGRV